MSLIIQGKTYLPFNPFNVIISDKRLKRIIGSSSKKDAVQMGVWGKIKDWICGNKKSKALKKIYELTHNDHEPDTESALKTITSFYQLKEMVYPGFQNRFQASVTENENGTYTFTFSIKDAVDERKLVYGNAEKDVHAFSAIKLTNNSEFLDTSNVSRDGVDAVLAKVAYNSDLDKLEGISSPNQDRLYLHLLSERTKQKMEFDQRLTQEWVALQMKCFDYYALQRSSLDSIEGMDLTKTIETENEWIYDFAKSMSSIKRNIQKPLAEKFNNETDRLHDEPIYAEITDLKVDYSKQTDNSFLTTASQLNESTLSATKHYKGSVNGDVYATVNKKKNEESELLKSIEDHIINNPKKFPVAYEHIKGYIAG